MPVEDKRTVSILIRQWEKLAKIKRDLIKQGLIKEEASPREVLEAIRKQLPLDLYAG